LRIFFNPVEVCGHAGCKDGIPAKAPHFVIPANASCSSFQRKLDCEGMDAEANIRAANGPKGKRQDCRASSSLCL
jgi:hypothetical protein